MPSQINPFTMVDDEEVFEVLNIMPSQINPFNMVDDDEGFEDLMPSQINPFTMDNDDEGFEDLKNAIPNQPVDCLLGCASP
ncbi:hypothetical protein EBH_0003340 [Eimeria brunetti]|uniref:Uncharacterized protein n=1 Tax=Eimeria brunetti TaxID=51314 RepID=U6LWT4_9EIME|nr:hypothetical protein EBH_0003340 [Eimeria brunetti]